MDIKISIVAPETTIPSLFDKEKYIVIYTENGGDGMPLVVLREIKKEVEEKN